MSTREASINQIEQEFERRYNRKLALVEAQFESQLESMSATIIAEVDELKDKLQKSHTVAMEHLDSEREWYRRMYETMIKEGIIKWRRGHMSLPPKGSKLEEQDRNIVIEDIDQLVRYVQMGKDLEKMIAPINENDAVKVAWNRFLVALRMTGYDGS